MADCIQNTKKYKDTEPVQLPTGLYATHNFVILRDTRQSSKSLVNWCRNHQEDIKTPAARICAEFPSCVNNKEHYRHFSPNQCRHKKKDQTDRFKIKTKRNNGLSFFIGETEQFKKNIDESLQDNKQKAQSQNNNAAISTTTGKLFTNTVTGIIFNFKHFADPEEVVSEYINTHIYNRTRLERVDKKKISASVITLHNIQKEASAELNEPEVDRSLNVRHASETLHHSDKLSKNDLKLEKRLPTIKILERAMATNNFIFEFGPLDALNSQNGRNYNTPSYKGRRDLQPDLNVSPALSSINNSNTWPRVQKSISLLPKLNSTKLQGINMENAEANNLLGRTTLPVIPREKNSRHKKKETRHKKLSSNINIQTADVKSNWQLLKQKRNRTQGNDRTNGQPTKRLYDTLEKMSSTISKTQDSYSDQKTNENLHKGGYKPLKKLVTQINNNKEPGKSKDMLFPVRKTPELNEKTMTLKYLQETIQGQRDFGKKLLQSNIKSSFKRVPKQSVSSTKSGSELNVGSDVFKEKASPNLNVQETAASRSKVEEYLDKYSLRIDKNTSDCHHEKMISYPSSEVVADMLAKLNIYDVGFHIDAEKKKVSINAVTSPRKYGDLEQILVSETAKSPSICKTLTRREPKLAEKEICAEQNQNISNKGVHPSHDLNNIVEIPGIQSLPTIEERRKLCTIEQSSGTNQIDKIAIRKKNNAFVEMGLNSLEGQIPKHLCSQILRSDFLKKDLSFKPANFFRSSLNFKNTLNSSSKLRFNFDNTRSESLKHDEWLLKKIRCIIAGTVGNSSKDGEKVLIKDKKLKFEDKYKKLHQIVEKKLMGTSGGKNFKENTEQSFLEKFLEVQNEILLNPRLQVILPRLVDGLPNFAEKQTR